MLTKGIIEVIIGLFGLSVTIILGIMAVINSSKKQQMKQSYGKVKQQEFIINNKQVIKEVESEKSTGLLNNNEDSIELSEQSRVTELLLDYDNENIDLSSDDSSKNAGDINETEII